jgi:hypothetical protein
MTPDHVRAFAAWPPCPVTIPDTLRPAPWLHITDVPLFISLHITRLDSPCALLRRLAERNLKALHRSLEQRNPSNPSPNQEQS